VGGGVCVGRLTTWRSSILSVYRRGIEIPNTLWAVDTTAAAEIILFWKRAVGRRYTTVSYRNCGKPRRVSWRIDLFWIWSVVDVSIVIVCMCLLMLVLCENYIRTQRRSTHKVDFESTKHGVTRYIGVIEERVYASRFVHVEAHTLSRTWLNKDSIHWSGDDMTDVQYMCLRKHITSPVL
jgi:hypothetical protein